MEEIRFKFKHVSQNGTEQTLFSKKGSFDGETLTLDETQIPIVAILRAQSRRSFLFLLVLQESGEAKPAMIAVKSSNLRELMLAINRCTSARWAELRRESRAKKAKEARDAGQEHKEPEFRTALCPYCQATIDLTGRLPSPQVFCTYCDTIATVEGTPPAGEQKYRICAECEYWAQPKQFTVFYFYFLLVVYGYRYNHKFMCNACMRSQAWWMFFGNLLFVLGVPTAIYQLIRAYGGGSTLSRDFIGLDNGNAHAKAGNLEKAEHWYGQIEQRLPHCAGVRYNHGRVLRNRQRVEEAAEQFLKALGDCSNFDPAYEGLCRCYESLGRTQELAALKEHYGDTGNKKENQENKEEGANTEAAEKPAEPQPE